MADVQVTDLAETLEIQDVDFLHVKNGSSGIDEKFLWGRFLLPINKGGTGATTAEAARTNLDVYSKSETHPQSYFGDSATKTVVTSSTDTTADRVLLVGADEEQFSAATKATIAAARYGGIGSSVTYSDFNIAGFPTATNKIFRTGFAAPNKPSFAGNYQVGFHLGSALVNYSVQVALGATNNAGWRQELSGSWGGWREFWDTGNTTVDGSGFIKEASPIVKLFSDKAEFNDQCPDTTEFEKVSTGHYLIKNTFGFASKGWWIETPKDTNGNVKFYTEWQQLEDDTIEVKTFEPDYSTGKCIGTVPMDITTDRWIDLRLEPEVVEDIQ